MVPTQNRLIPARKDKQKIINHRYKEYIDFTWVSILRPLCNQHREITYLESLLLYLTQECKQIFHSFIKCDYLLEPQQVECIRSQNKALLSNYLLRRDTCYSMMDKYDLMKCPYDLSVLKGRGNDDHAAWAEKFIIQN